MTTDLETQLRELQQTIRKELRARENEIKDLKAKHASESAVRASMKRMSTVGQIIEHAEKEGISVDEFVADAIITAMKSKSIPIDIELYNKLEARASARGLKIDELFKRSAFQDFVLDGLSRGAF